MAVSQVYVGNQVYDVNVSLEPAAHRNLVAIGSLLLRSPAGVTVPRRQLAEISQTTSRNQILHNGQLLQTVTSAVRGRTVSDFVNEAQQRINKEVSLPKRTLFAGEDQARAIVAGSADLYRGCQLRHPAAVKGIRALLLVLVNLPFASAC